MCRVAIAMEKQTCYLKWKYFHLSEKFLFWNVASHLNVSFCCLSFAFVCEVKIIDSKVLTINIDTYFKVSYLRKIFNISKSIDENELARTRGIFPLRLFQIFTASVLRADFRCREGVWDKNKHSKCLAWWRLERPISLHLTCIFSECSKRYFIFKFKNFSRRQYFVQSSWCLRAKSNCKYISTVNSPHYLNRHCVRVQTVVLFLFSHITIIGAKPKQLLTILIQTHEQTSISSRTRDGKIIIWTSSSSLSIVNMYLQEETISTFSICKWNVCMRHWRM